MTGSLTSYARHRKEHSLPGASLAAAQKAVKTGRITATKDGSSYTVDFAAADAEWAANTHPTRGREKRAVAEDETATKQATPRGCGRDEAGSVGTKYNAARAQKMQYEAANAELEFKRSCTMMARIEDLAEKLSIGAITREYVIERLRLNVEMALMTGPEAGAVANRGLELLGKEIGMFVDRKRISIGSLADATDEELASLLATAGDPTASPRDGV